MQTGNMTNIAARMPKVIEARLNCYSGDCSKCRQNAFVCGWSEDGLVDKVSVLQPKPFDTFEDYILKQGKLRRTLFAVLLYYWILY